MREGSTKNSDFSLESEGSIETATLESPSLKYKDSYLAALAEFQTEGLYLDLSRADIESDFAAFIEKIPAMRRELNRVPETEFWLINGGEYIGRLSIRHELNEELRERGGHIGYAIRSSQRGKGYGKKALELGLAEARKLGLNKVLITCDSTNISSRKIIESHKGILENEVAGEPGKPTKLRFWIDLEA